MGIGQREVLWNATEGVGQLDLNNMQRFIRAACSDWTLGQSGSFHGVGDVGVAAFDRTKALWCIGDSGAPYPTATPFQVTNLAGWIGQWKTGPIFPLATSALATNWGVDPYMMIYWLSPGELATVHATPDATNPRWDLVCVKLDDVSTDAADNETRLSKQAIAGELITSSAVFVKRRKVTITKQVVAGTPAGSPVIPAVPSGYQPYYAVLVKSSTAIAALPTPYNTGVFEVNNDFHDYRMPLGSFTIDLSPADIVGRAPTPASYTITKGPLGGVLFLDTVPLDMAPWIPSSPHSCRLIGVSHLTFSSAFFVSLSRYNSHSIGTRFQCGGNSTWDNLTLLSASSANGSPEATWISQTLDGSAGNNPPTAAIKPPWGTGYPSGYASRSERTIPSTLTPDSFAQSNTFNTIGIRYTRNLTPINTPLVAIVRMHFAGGQF